MHLAMFVMNASGKHAGMHRFDSEKIIWNGSFQP
jgi:hypothetical protein